MEKVIKLELCISDIKLMLCALEALIGSPVTVKDGNGTQLDFKTLTWPEKGRDYMVRAVFPNRQGVYFSILVTNEDGKRQRKLGLYPYREKTETSPADIRNWTGPLEGLATLAGNAKIYTVTAGVKNIIAEYSSPAAYEGMFDELLAARNNPAKLRALYYIRKTCKTKEQYLAALAVSESAFKKCVVWHKAQAVGPDVKKPLESGGKITYMAYRSVPSIERTCMLAYALYKQANGTMNAIEFAEKLLNGSNETIFNNIVRSFVYVEKELTEKKGG